MLLSEADVCGGVAKLICIIMNAITANTIPYEHTRIMDVVCLVWCMDIQTCINTSLYCVCDRCCPRLVFMEVWLINVHNMVYCMYFTLCVVFFL